MQIHLRDILQGSVIIGGQIFQFSQPVACRADLIAVDFAFGQSQAHRHALRIERKRLARSKQHGIELAEALVELTAQQIAVNGVGFNSVKPRAQGAGIGEPTGAQMLVKFLLVAHPGLWIHIFCAARAGSLSHAIVEQASPGDDIAVPCELPTSVVLRN